MFNSTPVIRYYCIIFNVAEESVLAHLVYFSNKPNQVVTLEIDTRQELDLQLIQASSEKYKIKNVKCKKKKFNLSQTRST